jgi:hypothetical protein
MSERRLAQEAVQQQQLEQRSTEVTPGVASNRVVQVVCPACGAKVQAVTYDNKSVNGHCAAAGQYISIDIEGSEG